MSTLIVGATGTVGREVTRRLAVAGTSVRAGTRSPERYAGPKGAQAVRLDVLDPSTFEGALEGVDRIFQVAPPGHADQRALLEPFVRAAAPQVKRIVTMTAQGVDADETMPFRQLERLVEDAAVEWVHLRPTWFSQNFITFWYPPIRDAGIIPLPAGDSQTAFIDALDIAACAEAALLRDDVVKRAWELTGPEALTYGEAAQILSDVSGRTIRYQPIDDDAFRSSLVQAGLPPDYAGLLAGLFGAVRAGLAARVTDSVRELTGQPPASVRAFAERERELLAATA